MLPLSILMSCAKKKSNIPAHVLLNSLQKRDKMLSSPRILSLFFNSFNRFNKNISTHLRPYIKTNFYFHSQDEDSKESEEDSYGLCDSPSVQVSLL